MRIIGEGCPGMDGPDVGSRGRFEPKPVTVLNRQATPTSARRAEISDLTGTGGAANVSGASKYETRIVGTEGAVG